MPNATPSSYFEGGGSAGGNSRGDSMGGVVNYESASVRQASRRGENTSDSLLGGYISDSSSFSSAANSGGGPLHLTPPSSAFDSYMEPKTPFGVSPRTSFTSRRSSLDTSVRVRKILTGKQWLQLSGIATLSQINSILVTGAGPPHTSSNIISVLYQATIPFTMVFSFFLLRRKYAAHQVVNYSWPVLHHLVFSSLCQCVSCFHCSVIGYDFLADLSQDGCLRLSRSFPLCWF